VSLHLKWWGLLFIAVWFFQLVVGAGASFAAMKIWPAREDRFAFRLMLALHAPMVNALMAIVLIFMARGVMLTWKFTITWFAASLLGNLALLPLILLLIKGLKDDQET
jgi:hypothetical protein